MRLTNIRCDYVEKEDKGKYQLSILDDWKLTKLGCVRRSTTEIELTVND